MQTQLLLVGVVGAYLLGSINSAVLLCRLAGLEDPRHAGSKNPGTTNVYRMGSTALAMATLLSDVLKGVIPTLIALELQLSPAGISLVTLAALLGHCYPLFFGFNGGKGVATTLGILLALSPLLALCLISLWCIVFLLWRYSSVASVGAAVAAPLLTFYWLPQYLVTVGVISLLLCWRHRPNLQRLYQHAELKPQNTTNRQ